MIKTICLYNHAGGVGKTTGASVIASLLASRGYRTLAVDMDPQSNLTQFLSASTPGVTIEQALGGGPLPMLDIQPFLRLVPASPNLSVVENELRLDNNKSALTNILSVVRNEYDFIIVDTPLSSDYLTINALTAAEYLLVPASPDGKSLAGISQVNKTIRDASLPATIDGIFLSCFNKRRSLDVFVEGKLREDYGSKVYMTRIRQCVALRECALQGMELLEYAPKSNAAYDYSALVDELLLRI